MLGPFDLTAPLGNGGHVMGWNSKCHTPCAYPTTSIYYTMNKRVERYNQNHSFHDHDMFGNIYIIIFFKSYRYQVHSIGLTGLNLGSVTNFVIEQ